MINAMTLLAPVFVEVLLTFVLLFWGGYVRVQAVRTRVVHPRDVALRQLNWPVQATKVMNAYQNQLELPFLFYVVIILTLTQLAPIPQTVMVWLAWLFVAFRIGHAIIHITTNSLSRRFFLFLASAIVLLLMWIVFFIRIAFGA